MFNDPQFNSIVVMAKRQLSEMSWSVGTYAMIYVDSRHGHVGVGDAICEFANAVSMPPDDMQKRIEVIRRFGSRRHEFPHLLFSHFFHAMTLEPPISDECLTWANDMRATVAEMKAWQRAQAGEPLLA